MTDSSNRVLVMGVGNPLMGDDGVGPRVIELLVSGYTFPDNVELVDAGTMSLMILDLLRGVDDLVIVDAMRSEDTPAGTVAVLSPDEISPVEVRHSMHDTGIGDVLQAAELLDRAPRTVAIGVEIESIDQWALDLSAPAEAAVPVAAAAVLEELRRLGVEPVPTEDVAVHARILEALRTFAPMPDSDARSADS